jgi:hypothetical protein
MSDVLFFTGFVTPIIFGMSYDENLRLNAILKKLKLSHRANLSTIISQKMQITKLQREIKIQELSISKGTLIVSGTLIASGILLYNFWDSYL